jgi:transcriptional regulator with XRE-family HTH domain
MVINMQLGERIRLIREKEKMGRAEFCERIDLPKQTLISIETGRRKDFSALSLEKVAKAFPEYIDFLLLETKKIGQRNLQAENKDYRKLALIYSASQFLSPIPSPRLKAA